MIYLLKHVAVSFWNLGPQVLGFLLAPQALPSQKRGRFLVLGDFDREVVLV